ncbi:MAG: TrmB family transcriptional regulator [Methanobacteriota archaeon]
MRIAEALETLGKLGFSRYEAVVFVNLARAGVATAGEIARATGVNRVQTYRALDGLEARGLVEVTLDRPKRYAARAINEVFDLAAEEKRAELDGLDAMRRGLIDAWPRLARSGRDGPSVRLQVIKGRSQIYKAIRQVVGGATKEVLAFTTTKGLQRSYRAGINEVLLEAMRRGVKPKLIANVQAANAALMARVAERVALRHVDWHAGRFIVVDRREMIAFLIQDEGTIRGESETAMWTNSPDFVKAHLDIFENAWAAGASARERLAAVRRG